MNRDDWTIVGLRLFGIWMMVEVVLNLAEILHAVLDGPAGLLGWAVVALLAKFWIGAVLAFRAAWVTARLGGSGC